MKNYYKILELEENSSSDEIKKSFRRLSLMYHPDRNKSLDAASRFQEINEAYEVLGNIENRNKYNRKINNENNHNQLCASARHESRIWENYSTVTDFAKLRGLSIGRLSALATAYAKNCMMPVMASGARRGLILGIMNA